MDKFEKQITEYIAVLNYEDLPAKAIQAAKERYLDSFATSTAAYNTSPAVSMRNFALQASAKNGATVFGTEHKSPVDYAAVYLGTLIRALDWNDTYLNREPAHPSDNIPACLSVAEAEGKNGRDLILATVISYELHCRLCDAAGIRKKGWDHVTYGSVASAGAAARLMGFTREQIRDTLGISITTGNYLRQTRIGTISKWKAAAYAQACQNAIRAALYVKNGFDGPSKIFAGKHGLINQITSGEFDLAESFGGQGSSEFKILDTYIKYFPAEYHSQSAIWAALELRRMIGRKNIKNIRKIHVETSFHSYEIIGKESAKWAPKTKETADHSLPYIVVVALMDGDITLRQFDNEHLHDVKLLSFVQKVTVAENKEYTHIYGRSFPNKITVTMQNGNLFEKEVLDPKGHPNNPLTREELESKFLTASDMVFKKEQQDRIIDAVWNLEKIQDMSELMRMFKVE